MEVSRGTPEDPRASGEPRLQPLAERGPELRSGPCGQVILREQPGMLIKLHAPLSGCYLSGMCCRIYRYCLTWSARLWLTGALLLVVTHAAAETFEERLSRLEAAADTGDSQAAWRLLEELVLRAESLNHADPERAYAFFVRITDVWRSDPGLDISHHQWQHYNAYLEALRMAAEAGPFDAAQFLQKNQLDESNLPMGGYRTWQLAEQASQGHFGEPDPNLVFQLVIRGGEVPSEWKLAVTSLYPKWKAGEPIEFDLCNYVMSAMGVGFCNHRRELALDHELNVLLDGISRSLPPAQDHWSADAYEAAMTYFRLKAEHEEGHGGAPIWKARHMESSIARHKWRFLEWLKERTNLLLPEELIDIDGVEAELLDVLKELNNEFAAHSGDADFRGISQDGGLNVQTWEGVEETQEAWHRFRRRTFRLLYGLGGPDFAEQWQAHLYAERLKVLQSTLSVVQGKGVIK